MSILTALMTICIIWSPSLWADYVTFGSDPPELTHVHTNLAFEWEEEDENRTLFYIPVASTTAGTLLGNLGFNARGNDFRVSLLDGSVARDQVSIPLDITVSTTSETMHLFVAAKKENSEEYRVLTDLGTVSTGSRTITFNLDRACQVDQYLEFNCQFFRDGNSKKEILELYISIGPAGEVNGGNDADSVTPDDERPGVHLLLSMSSRIDFAIPPVLEELHKGDGRLQANYRGSISSEMLRNIAYVIDQGALDEATCNAITSPRGIPPSALSSGGNHVSLNSSQESGRSMIKGLTNGHCYSVQIYHLDKYHFTSLVSNGRSAIPEDLPTLLKKQACFLLTAGFGGDHFIVRYFRQWRDQTLRRFYPGRAFIGWYERIAPLHAPAIAASPTLAALVRAFAWSAWFLLEYGSLLLLLPGVIGAFMLGRRYFTQDFPCKHE